MKMKFTRPIHVYYFLTLSFLLVSLVGGIYFYWAKGPANAENVRAVFEASMQVDALQNRHHIENIKDLVERGVPGEAINLMKKVEVELRDVNGVINLTTKYSKMEKELLATKAALNELLSSPNVGSILEVFKKKVNSFEQFVENNNWRTLLRMSRRIDAKLSGREKQNFYGYTQLAVLKRELVRDISIMRNVTTASVLSQQNKNIILLKLDTLGTEITLLEKYLEDVKVFEKDFAALSESFNSWFKQVGPEISLKRIQFEKNARLFFLGMICAAFFILTAMVLGVFAYKVSLRSTVKKLERVIISFIRDGIIPVKNKLPNMLSANFQNEFAKYHDYVHKRMSFGTIFKDAVPFSALLLDSNLNVVWGNQLFFESWGLDELKTNNKQISWDYVQRFTNLGEDDPVLLALNDRVAGIYQIQVRWGHQQESVPFEMYVSPVEYAGQSRIMIFFYPLSTLEETISNLTKSIVGPVSKTLDVLASEGFNKEFREKIKKDFEIAGIDEIFAKFTNYNEIISQQKLGLMNEIESLENTIYDQHKLKDDVVNILKEKLDFQSKIVQSISDVKEKVISVIDLRQSMEQLGLNTIVTSKNLMKDENFLLEKFDHSNHMIAENLRAFGLISQTVTKFKELKEMVEEFNSRIIDSLNQALIFQGSNIDREMQQILGKIRLDIKGFEKVLVQFGSITRAFDVMISKINMMADKNEVIDTVSVRERAVQAREMLENDMFNISKLTKTAQDTDEQMVQILKNLVSLYKQNRQQLTVLVKLVKDNEHLEIPQVSKSEAHSAVI